MVVDGTYHFLPWGSLQVNADKTEAIAYVDGDGAYIVKDAKWIAEQIQFCAEQIETPTASRARLVITSTE